MADAPPKTTTIDEPTTSDVAVDAQPTAVINNSPASSSILDSPGGS